MTGMVPEDVFELTGVSDPRLSFDGRTVAYVVGAVDAKANDYRGAIWLAPADGAAEPRRFTSGVKLDADPRWSPDGTQLAFTSNRDGKAMQLYVMPLGGGEPRRPGQQERPEGSRREPPPKPPRREPVSYTHLTLPTKRIV